MTPWPRLPEAALYALGDAAHAQNVIVSRANYGADFDELVALAGG
jgi:hypothetical protein